MLSVYETGCQTRLICQWFKDMCTTWQHVTIMIYTANKHAQFCRIARLIHWSMALIFFFQDINLVLKPLSKPVSFSDGPFTLEWVNGKAIFDSQCKMVANSLMWWFQSLEKAPTSLYVWLHNILWIHLIWIFIMWIHVIRIHVCHMNSSSIFWQYIFIITWAMSGEHLSPIRSFKYLYLPNGVMMVQEFWLLLSSSNV